jgi:NADPH-dependent 2,4-dienoyl-CoA reductase/sulfur reductase-like enzyme
MVSAPKQRKNTAIIGGGCAGMKAAMDLYDRGHSVTIYEKEAELGGQLNLAAVPSFKWTQRSFRNYLFHQMSKRNIEVIYNTPVKSGDLDGKYDMVFVAIGAEPLVPRIPGIEGLPTYKDVFKDPSIVNGRAIIIGGGEIGLELGIYLNKLGHETLIIEMKDKLAAEMTPVHFRRPYREMWEKLEGFKWELNATVTKVEGKNVTYTREGKETIVPGGTIIIASGSKPLRDESVSFGGFDHYRPIGDCWELGNIATALRSAHYAANNI